jgi:hypothetical protein
METAVQTLLLAIDRIKEINDELYKKAADMQDRFKTAGNMPSEADSQEYLLFLATAGGKLEVLNAQMYEAADEVRSVLRGS